MASVKKEVYENRVDLALSHAEDANFLEGVEDVSRYVVSENGVNVIHRSYLGVQPDVLINNTTYPIPQQVLDDEDVPISLDKFQTKRTPITDDELYASSYDKVDAAAKTHVIAITESKTDKAIHALAPASHTSNTPVLLTTGEDDGTGRKKLTKKDLIAFRRAFGKTYRRGIRLVLCNDHINDVLEWDENFALQYSDGQTGKITNKYGFEIYEYGQNPFYNVTTKTKLSFNGVPTSDHQMASVAFYPKRTVKANSKTKMYHRVADTDPENQQNEINFRHYAIAMPTENLRIGAIVSGNAL